MKFNKLVAMCALAGLITTACSQKRKAVIADDKAGKAEDALKKDDDKAEDDKKDDAKNIPSLEEREVVLKAIHEAALADLNAKLEAANAENDKLADGSKDEEIETLKTQIEDLRVPVEIVGPFKSSNDDDSEMFVVNFNAKTVEATTRCKVGEEKVIKEDVVVFDAIYMNVYIALSNGKSKNEELNCSKFMPSYLEKIIYAIDGDAINIKFNAAKAVDDSSEEVEETITEAHDHSFMPITEREDFFFESEDGENQATDEEINTEEVEAPATEEVEAPATEEVEAPATEEVEAPATEEVEAPATEEVEAPATEEVEAPANEEVEAPANEEVEAPANEEVEAPANEEVEAPATEEVEAPATDEVDAEEDELDAEVIEVSPETTTVVEDEETEETEEIVEV
jgi:hypothetical protein